MRQSTLRICLGLALLGAALCAGREVVAQAGPLVALELQAPGEEGSETATLKRFTRLAAPVYAGIDAEQPVAELRVAVELAKGAGGKLLVEQQEETSVTLVDNDRRFTMTKWKHGRSAWRRLAPVPVPGVAGSFQVLEPRHRAFPATSRDDLLLAVERYGGDDWLEVALDCKGARSGPCSVMVTRVNVRVSLVHGERTRVLGELRLDLPAGSLAPKSS